MIVEHSAGGIIYKNVDRKIYVVMIKDSFGKWTFPKGHIEKNEKPEEAALRESQEETGLTDLKYKSQIGQTDFWFKDRWEGKNDLIHKIVSYYAFEAKNNFDFIPQTKEINDAKWVDIDKIAKLSDYKDNSKIIETFLSTIK